jgi:hypothetical protein
VFWVFIAHHVEVKAGGEAVHEAFAIADLVLAHAVDCDVPAFDASHADGDRVGTHLVHGGEALMWM